MNEQISFLHSSNRKERGFLLLICAVTVLSQIPFFVDRGLSSPLTMGTWMCMFLVLLWKNRKLTIPRSMFFLFVVVTILVLYRLVMAMLSADSFYINIEKAIMLALFVMFVGYLCGQSIYRKDIDLFLTVYIWATVLLTIVLYITVLRKVDFSNIQYAYDSKNSSGQIILSAVILIFTRKITDKKKTMLVYLLISLFLIYCLILMKTRACIIFIPVIIFLLLTRLNLNKRLKYTMIVVVGFTIVFILANKNLFQTFVIDLFYRGGVTFDLENASSGRFSQWQMFGMRFAEHPWFGKVPQQYESLIITSYLENGMFFGTLILCIALFPIYWCIKYLNIKDDLFITVLLLSVCYIGNGILEQYAPFGPGVKCFLLWFLIGCLMAILYREKMKEN